MRTSRRSWSWASLIVSWILLSAAGCQSQAARGPYDAPPDGTRRTAQAEQLTKEAADLIESDPDQAEALLREALAADIFFGPAHNNLGVLYLTRDQFYEAASEFEWARKLMPGHPDPRLNLGITLERAGRGDDAIAAYTAALEVYPDYLPAIQGMARHSVRFGLSDERLNGWLREIVMRSTDPKWREWAMREQHR